MLRIPTVIALFCIIANFITAARYVTKNSKLDLYEIRENQLNKKIVVKPVNLQFDLESEEPKASNLNKLLLIQQNKKTSGLSRNNLQKLQALKDRKIRERIQKEPLILILAANNDLFNSDSAQKSDEFLDETRTQNLMKLGSSEVIYHIVPPKREKKQPKGRKLTYFLRSYTAVPGDRTMAPIHKHDFAYDED